MQAAPRPGGPTWAGLWRELPQGDAPGRSQGLLSSPGTAFHTKFPKKGFPSKNQIFTPLGVGRIHLLPGRATGGGGDKEQTQEGHEGDLHGDRNAPGKGAEAEMPTCQQTRPLGGGGEGMWSLVLFLLNFCLLEKKFTTMKTY